ncbi:RNA-binding S4 domain-containing protein [Georgenia sp. AZ-5]|uniref:RNA-binding S4 domain-containing protein n=1 Tax=Georgenia sp. AZ-5 TaxID=3367526 RepID=UPI003753EF88
MTTDDYIPTVPTTGTIRLGQFLKLANLAESGAHARDLIADGEVSVDGAVETRRGRQLSHGMVVAVETPTGTVSARVG